MLEFLCGLLLVLLMLWLKSCVSFEDAAPNLFLHSVIFTDAFVENLRLPLGMTTSL